MEPTASRRAMVLYLFGAVLLMRAASGNSTSAVQVQADYVPTNSPKTFYSSLKPCPAACVGKPDNWTVYSSVDLLTVCDQPLLLDFAIYNPLDDPNTNVKLRVCTTGNPHVDENSLQHNANSLVYNTNSTVPSQNTGSKSTNTACLSANQTQATLEMALMGRRISSESDDLLTTLQVVQSYLENPTNCGTPLIFSYYRGSFVGVYVGSAIDGPNTSSSVIQQLIDGVKSDGTPMSMIAQICGSHRESGDIFGVATDSTGNIGSLSSLQKAVRSWSDGLCVNSAGATSYSKAVSIWDITASPLEIRNSAIRHLHARGDCTTTKVVSGDSCGTLAARCGISGAVFTQYNSDPRLCSTLQPDQVVCCSPGTLPDNRPQENTDGSCAYYTIVANDNCSKLAAANGLTIAMIENFNDKTWGWTGCANIMIGLNICLSDGSPPMPAPMANAVCGPTKPGSMPVLAGKGNLTMMNQCPLNACCDIWGQCGIDSSFCTDKRGPSNNPGTAPPGMNGCISNCGTDVVNNSTAPSTFQSIGYYESWNWARDCLHLRAKSIDTSSYTHIHWAFAVITSDWGVFVNDTYSQWDDFKALVGAKRILSFGGWGYSTDSATFDILRQAMTAANVNAFTDNVVGFLTANGLDGVDFDWEYPGAPDIPGIPAGLDTDGPNYLTFLTILKKKLPTGMSLSIAAPASFWYLQAFPIAQMSKLLDYIVYMTYDLHGQWDYGNKWSSPGCPAGNCLRSHVNITETMLALAMITKAGVSANKINVGVSSYGRSFKMEEANCWTDMCSFLGPDSQAAPGMCTDTPGYLADAEIQAIIDDDANNTITFYDEVSGAEILVYDDTEWVAFMSNDTKTARKAKYSGLNFGGTVDWTLDLQSFDYDDEAQTDEDQAILDSLVDDLPPTAGLPDCTGTYTTFDQLDADAGSMPSNCKSLYAMQVLDALLTVSLANYTAIMSESYDKKFHDYSTAITQSAAQHVNDFLDAKGNQYFTCVVTETTWCCKRCKEISSDAQDRACSYCFNGACTKDTRRDGSRSLFARNVSVTADGGPPDKPGQLTKYKNVTEPCPPDTSQRGYGADSDSGHYQSIWWTLSPDKADSFWVDLLNTTGITQDNIIFTEVSVSGRSCGKDDLAHESHMDCLNEGGFWLDAPAPHGYTESDIPNPKDLIAKALANGQDLAPQIKDAISDIKVFAYPNGLSDQSDLVDAIAVPVLMIADAVEQMQQVVTIGDSIEAAKRKSIIMTFLGALLFLIPFVGEALGAVDVMASIGRIVALLGDAGNAASDIYTIVDDPENAPLAIFGLVFAPLALLDGVAIGKAAGLSRGMESEDVQKLGKNVGDRMKTLQKMTGFCRKG